MADEYMLLADFSSYCQAHKRALEAYADRQRWNQMSLINIARSGLFAADRSISDYAREIWHCLLYTSPLFYLTWHYRCCIIYINILSNYPFNIVTLADRRQKHLFLR